MRNFYLLILRALRVLREHLLSAGDCLECEYLLLWLLSSSFREWPNGTAYIRTQIAIYSSEPFEKEMPTGKWCQASVKSIKFNSLGECSIFTWMYIMFRVYESLVAISLNDSASKSEERNFIWKYFWFSFKCELNRVCFIVNYVQVHSWAVRTAFDRQNRPTHAYTYAQTLVCFIVLAVNPNSLEHFARSLKLTHILEDFSIV